MTEVYSSTPASRTTPGLYLWSIFHITPTMEKLSNYEGQVPAAVHQDSSQEMSKCKGVKTHHTPYYTPCYCFALNAKGVGTS